MASRSRKKSSRAGWILGILYLALLVFFSTGKSGFLQQIRIKYRKATLEQKKKYTVAEVDSLEAEKDTLNTLYMIEKIAREKYGMGRENEKVYHIETEESKDVE